MGVVEGNQPMILTAFAGQARLASGTLDEIAATLAEANRAGASILVFDEAGRVRDLDLRGTPGEIVARHETPAAPRRGRPRLGVVSREVTLLPRHWEWLASQRGGASATLRRLVDAARKENDGKSRARQDAAYHFLTAIGGDLPRYEEAIRALYAGDLAGFETQMSGWPADILAHALRLAAGD
ncbi:MAG: DUF2239 family protein [Paracoccaceae bacterium]|nr:DUF2239 family protein [Paracoccaceae bacterium]